jgi:hypothetical protein
MSNINSIKVRMYRHGFGDCFLIRFYSGETLKLKMLIDCGLKHNDSVKGVPLSDVVKNIASEVSITKNGKQVPHLDILVITHEHWDHVSAFKPESKLFDKFEIDKIWLAWTENPDDEEAKIINAHLQDNITALTLATRHIKANTKAKANQGYYTNMYNGHKVVKWREEYDAALERMTEFFGPMGVTKTSPGGIKYKDHFKISIETQKALDHVKHKLAKGKAGIRYFKPGTLLEKYPDLPGIRVYVLGPPRNEKINMDKPSSGANKEVYFGAGKTEMMGFVKGVLKMAGKDMGNDDGSPFSDLPAYTLAEAKREPFFKDSYLKQTEEWRTIDDDWLDFAGSLALQMDNDTNNTSLVLAFEFMGSDKILLFPGDAQVGSWLSWHDLSWRITRDNKKETVDASYILNNTVFYKAGHHASHNATLKEQGLELMNHDELVTFVPEKDEQYNGIPFKPLMKRLKEKSKGRVLVSADKNFEPGKTLRTKPAALSAQEWKDFKKNITCTDLYIEYTING